MNWFGPANPTDMCSCCPPKLCECGNTGSFGYPQDPVQLIIEGTSGCCQAVEGINCLKNCTIPTGYEYPGWPGPPNEGREYHVRWREVTLDAGCCTAGTAGWLLFEILDLGGGIQHQVQLVCQGPPQQQLAWWAVGWWDGTSEWPAFEYSACDFYQFDLTAQSGCGGSQAATVTVSPGDNCVDPIGSCCPGTSWLVDDLLLNGQPCTVFNPFVVSSAKEQTQCEWRHQIVPTIICETGPLENIVFRRAAIILDAPVAAIDGRTVVSSPPHNLNSPPVRLTLFTDPIEDVWVSFENTTVGGPCDGTEFTLDFSVEASRVIGTSITEGSITLTAQ